MDTLQFDRSEQAAIAIIGILAYTQGFEIFMARCIRPDGPGLDQGPAPDAQLILDAARRSVRLWPADHG